MVLDIIHQFIDQNMALVFFIYGLTFIMLGMVAALQYKPQSKLVLPQNLWILSIFGICHGLAEWGYIFIAMQASSLTREALTIVEMGHITLLVFSFVFLFQFGLNLLREKIGRTYRYIKFLPAGIFIFWVLSFYSGITLYRGSQLHFFLTNVEIMGRYLIALPASFLAGFALLHQENELVGPVLFGARRPARLGAISFFIYGILSGLVVPAAGFFPANTINAYNFHEFVNLPVQLFRSATVVAMTYFIFRLLEFFEVDFTCRLEHAECQQSVLNERLRISRDLHDGILQSVYAMGLNCENISYLVDSDPKRAKDELTKSICSLNGLIQEIREFIGQLRVEHSEIKTFYLLIKGAVEDFSGKADKIEISSNLDQLVDVNICPKLGEQVANIVKEALNNVSRHAEASEVTIRAENGKRGLWIKIADNGKGFRIPRGWRGRFALAHQGISNMRERARTVGGELEIKSKPGQGTTVTLYMPKDGLNQSCGGGYTFCGFHQSNSHLAG